MGREAARRTRPRASRSCCAPRWAPGTAARRGATTRGATKRSCSRSCATRSGSRVTDAQAVVLHCRRRRARSRVGADRRGAAHAHRGAVPSASAVRRHHAQHRDLGAVRGAARARAIACLRFNFRGVEGSGGEHSDGRDEPLDVRAAIDAATELGLAGAARARRLVVRRRHGADRRSTHRVAGWVGIAPPLRFRAATITRGRRRPAAEALVLAAARRVPRAGRDRGRGRDVDDTHDRGRPGREPLLRGPHRPRRRPRPSPTSSRALTRRETRYDGRAVRSRPCRLEERRPALDRRPPRGEVDLEVARSPSSYACSSSSNACVFGVEELAVPAEEVVVDTPTIRTSAARQVVRLGHEHPLARCRP